MYKPRHIFENIDLEYYAYMYLLIVCDLNLETCYHRNTKRYFPSYIYRTI